MLMNLKRTKIVCTIGPASESKDMLKQLINNGLNVCRLNFSHGDYDEHGARIRDIKEVRKELNTNVAILLDTKGPEIRTGKFSEPEVLLEEGQEFIITVDEVMGDNTKCCVSYKGLTNDVKKGNIILIDDGLVGLEVQEVVGNDIKCIVKNAGIVKNNKGVNVPGVAINLPAITEKDRNDILFGIENGIDFIAASFVRKASDVLAIREILEEKDATDIKIISKIENQEGVDNIDSIIDVSDGIMVARGDLGVEIPTEEIPLAQKMMIRKCNAVAKPVITATQMLDSMMRNPRPTRAEVTDVANAIFDGTDAVMLSGETAAGKYPAEAVDTMANIARRAESALDYDAFLKRAVSSEANITDAISYSTCTTARDLKASAILTATASGQTARMVCKFRPTTPIVATSDSERTVNQLMLSWGVYPILADTKTSTDEVIQQSIDEALNNDYIKSGDLVVVTAGVPVGVAGSTNLLKVHIVGEVIGKGMGVGKTHVQGKVCVIKTDDDIKKFNEGDIIVAPSTTPSMNEIIEKSSGIITEHGGLTSHAAIVGLNMNKPVVVSVKDITTKVEDGQLITLDSQRGMIYKGEVRVL
ncbi:MAG: pyruvate kinase [Peptostreptococcaceae bacterium]|nr:pyruvate kinase [Peptostreptococcaceae bacterium]